MTDDDRFAKIESSITRMSDAMTSLAQEVTRLVESQNHAEKDSTRNREEFTEKYSEVKSSLEKLDSRVTRLEHGDGNKAIAVVKYVAAGIATILLGYIAFKLGLQ